MDNKEILEKAIQKATDGGWTKGEMLLDAFKNPDLRGLESYEMTDAIRSHEQMKSLLWPVFAYDHDFAKALWGEDLIQLARGNNIGQTITYHAPAWQVRLQDMVILEDPIKYLGDNI